jgi:hypothetical protein
VHQARPAAAPGFTARVGGAALQRGGERECRRTIKLALPKPLRRLLQRQRRLALRLTAKPKDPAGNTRTVTKRVTPKLKRNRGR